MPLGIKAVYRHTLGLTKNQCWMNFTKPQVFKSYLTAYRHADKQTKRLTEKQTNKQTDMHTNKHTDMHTNRQTDKQNNAKHKLGQT